jgi:hypothetical protein
MVRERREPTQEERDTDTALHLVELQADRPPPPEILERLRRELLGQAQEPPLSEEG